nr:MAG TPA: hypothetical protein [Caudoviricetes sp.]
MMLMIDCKTQMILTQIDFVAMHMDFLLVLRRTVLYFFRRLDT